MRVDCWEHPSTDSHGYARAYVGRRAVRPYRLAYEVLIGPIPTGLEPDHLCRNRACYNPWHLEWVTHQENCRRAGTLRPLKDRCPSGHFMSPENTYTWRGEHRCVQCNRKASREYQRRKAASCVSS